MSVDWAFEVEDTDFDAARYAQGLADLLGSGVSASDVIVTQTAASDGTLAVSVVIEATTPEGAEAAAAQLEAETEAAIATAVGATSVTSTGDAAVAVTIIPAPSPPTPFAPLASGSMYQGTLTFGVQVAGAGGRRLSEGATTSAAAVASAVSSALVAAGHPEYQVDATGPDASDNFVISIVTSGTDCQAVMDTVDDASFAADLGTSLGSAVTVSSMSCAIAVVPAPSPPLAPPTPSDGGGAADPGANLDDSGEDNVATGGTDGGDDDDFPAWAIAILVIFLLICLCPLLCVLYAAARFGAGNVSLWFRYKFCHTNPTLPALYMPKEDRERIKKQLGLAKGEAMVDTKVEPDEATSMTTDRV